MNIEDQINNVSDSELGRVMKAALHEMLRRGFSEPTPEEDGESARIRDCKFLRERSVPENIAVDATDPDRRSTPVLAAVMMWKDVVYPKVLQALKDKTRMPSNAWPILFGPPGRGKSVAAAWLLLNVKSDGYNEYFPTWAQASEYVRIRPSNRDEDAARVRKIERSPFLVLDDIGREHVGGTAYASGAIGELLSLRHSERRITVLTANLPEEMMRQGLSGKTALIEGVLSRYDSVLASRVNEFGSLFEATGPDLRAMQDGVTNTARHSPPMRPGTRARR
jgi:hypothetical protein